MDRKEGMCWIDISTEKKIKTKFENSDLRSYPTYNKIQSAASHLKVLKLFIMLRISLAIDQSQS